MSLPHSFTIGVVAEDALFSHEVMAIVGNVQTFCTLWAKMTRNVLVEYNSCVITFSNLLFFLCIKTALVCFISFIFFVNATIKTLVKENLKTV